MLKSRRKKELYDRDGSCACAGGDYPDILFFLADHLEGVCQSREGDHSCAVLIIVENRNIGALLELSLNLETAGSRYILQVNPSERAGDQRDSSDKLIDIFGLDAEREGIHIAERFEQDTLAFHDRHTCFGTDIAKTQHRGTVRDDSTYIMPSGQFIRFINILLDFQTGLCDTGCIRQGQILFCFDRNTGDNLDFAFPFSVQSQRLLCIIH